MNDEETTAALSSMVRAAHRPTALFDRDMRYLAANVAFHAQYGLGPEPLDGRSHYEVFPDIPNRWKDIHRSALAGETRWSEEDYFDRTTGRSERLGWELVPWRGSDGTVGGLVLTSWDISHHLKQGVLNQAEWEPFRILFERSAQLVALLEPPGLLDRCNPAMASALGTGRDQAAGIDLRDRMRTVDPGAFDKALRSVFEGEREEVQLHASMANVPGGDRWFHVAMSAMRLVPGRTQALLMATDQTEQKQIEQQILRERETLRAVLSTVADAIIVADSHGTMRIVNPAACSLFGHPPEALEGHNVRILMPSDVSEHHDQYMDHYARTGQRHIIGKPRDVVGMRRDGSRMPLRLSITEVDHLGLFAATLHDLTESHRLREGILSIASLERQRIGRDLHDDVQQQLSGIGLLADTLRDQLAKPEGAPRRRELASTLSDSLTQVQRTVQQLARGLVHAPVGFQGLRDALAELARTTTQSANVPCRVQGQWPDVGFTDEQATHLYRIAQEAINNAVRHAGARGILVALEQEDGNVALRVEDDGVGLPAAKPWAPGVGLRLMEHRCSLLGGTLRLEPRRGGGTSVSCSIPILSHLA